MLLVTLFYATLPLITFAQSPERVNCVFRKDGYEDFHPEECLHIRKISANETHILIPVGYEHFCYVPAVYQNARLSCFDVEEMPVPCFSILKRSNERKCCVFVRRGYKNYQPTDCISNSLTVYSQTHTLVAIFPTVYCKVPYAYENVKPDCVRKLTNYPEEVRDISTYKHSANFNEVNCDFSDDIESYPANDCLYISAISSNDTHVLRPTLLSDLCFVPKAYANATAHCFSNEEVPNCKSVIRGPNGNVCCMFVEEGYENYVPSECIKNIINPFNRTYHMRKIFIEGFYCGVPWKYEHFAARCISPVAASPAKHKTDANGNPLPDGGTISIG